MKQKKSSIFVSQKNKASCDLKRKQRLLLLFTLNQTVQTLLYKYQEKTFAFQGLKNFEDIPLVISPTAIPIYLQKISQRLLNLSQMCLIL
jgi:hypothetical protein